MARKKTTTVRLDREDVVALAAPVRMATRRPTWSANGCGS